VATLHRKLRSLTSNASVTKRAPNKRQLTVEGEKKRETAGKQGGNAGMERGRETGRGRQMSRPSVK
jgi:hypothetical protein